MLRHPSKLVMKGSRVYSQMGGCSALTATWTSTPVGSKVRQLMGTTVGNPMGNLVGTYMGKPMGSQASVMAVLQPQSKQACKVTSARQEATPTQEQCAMTEKRLL